MMNGNCAAGVAGSALLACITNGQGGTAWLTHKAAHAQHSANNLRSDADREQPQATDKSRVSGQTCFSTPQQLFPNKHNTDVLFKTLHEATW